MSMDDPVLINDWHPVASLDQFEQTAIIGVRLLGEDLVLWKEGSDYHAWQDLCVHRGAKLSLGKVVDGCLRCAYHGWTYNGEGRCGGRPGDRRVATARVIAAGSAKRTASALRSRGDCLSPVATSTGFELRRHVRERWNTGPRK